MEWQLVLLLIFGSLIILMALGLPVAFSFMLVNIIGVILFWGGGVGLEQLILSIRDSVTVFTLLPMPLFILMGEVMFHSGIAPLMMDALDKSLGRLPGRLSLLAVGGGTLLATLSGITMASVAILGSLLVPEMERRGYQKPMSMGPILGSGGLALLIPPSSVAVFIGAIGRISVGRLLISIIIPGLMLAALYVVYIITRCLLQPSLAPSYEVTLPSLSKRFIAIVHYVLPLGFIIFLVIGVIFLGVTTPTEAAATGAVGTFILAAFYKRLNWEVVKKSVQATLEVTIMIFLIITAAKAFSQILAYTGGGRGLVEFAVGLPLSPIFIIIAMAVLIVIMGAFMDFTSIVMITIPLYMPVVHALGFNPVWFGTLTLLSLTTGAISPPFGLDLFVMKGVAPADTTMREIYGAALPFVSLELTIVALIIAFPAVALWLPGLMR